MDANLSGKQMLDVVARSYEGAKANGFWDDERNFGEIIALIHSEISEAYAAWDADLFAADEHIPAYLNWQVELADAYIRVADAIGGYGGEYTYDCDEVYEGTVPGPVFQIDLSCMRNRDLIAKLADAIAYVTNDHVPRAELDTLLEARYFVPPQFDAWNALAHYELAVSRVFPVVEGMSPAESVLLHVHKAASYVLERSRKAAPPYDDDCCIALDLLVLLATIDAAQSAMIPPSKGAPSFYEIINAKLDYNKSRGYKHGKRF